MIFKVSSLDTKFLSGQYSLLSSLVGTFGSSGFADLVSINDLDRSGRFPGMGGTILTLIVQCVMPDLEAKFKDAAVPRHGGVIRMKQDEKIERHSEHLRTVI